MRGVEHYNVRLNSAIGYIAPKDMLAGRQLMRSGIGSSRRRENGGRVVGDKPRRARPWWRAPIMQSRFGHRAINNEASSFDL
jgi:hypothetical protein